MKSFENFTKPLMWFMALPLVAFMAGCSGNDPILGNIDVHAVPVPPTVTAVAPANIATAVPINTKIITAAFSKAMTGTTLNTTSFKLECPAGTPVLGGGAVTYLSAGNVATLPLPAATNLPPSTVCTATVTAAAKDTTGLPMASDFVWTFTTGATPDTTLPGVALTVPVTTTPGPTLNVPANSAITAVFTEDMAPATLASPATNFTLTCAPSCVTPTPAGTVSYTPASRIATFKLTPAGTLLEAGKTYTATIIGTGTTPAKDLAGNALAGISTAPATPNDYVWTFTVASPDIIRPTITLESPADLAPAALVGSTVNATFSEAMDLSSATFTLTAPPPIGTVTGTWVYYPASKIATFTPGSPLISNTTYTATITGAKDLAGNPLTTVVSTVAPINKPNPWTFTTEAAGPVVPLGALSSFAIATYGDLSNTGATKINGDTVLHPTSTCNLIPILFADGPGFGACGGFAPTNNAGDQVITSSFPDAVTAPPLMSLLTVKWNNISPAIMAGGTVLGCSTIGTGGGAGALIGCAGNATLPPGVYTGAPSIGIAGDLTLDGGGDPNALFVFQAPSSTVIAADGAASPGIHTRILLINGAKASNVWWYVGSSATLGTNSEFQGNILASASITMKTGATSCGRLLAGASGSGAFVFDSNVVSVPGHPNAPPTALGNVPATCQ